MVRTTRRVFAWVVPGVALLAFLVSDGCRLEATDPERERICLGFLQEEMMTEQGVLLTRARVVRRRLLGDAIGEGSLGESGALSESVGLLMMYAVASSDRDLLDRQFGLLQARLLSPFGLAYWKLSADLELTANSNASVDDLRIAHALLLAYEKWSDERYLHQAMDLSRNLRIRVAPGGEIRNFLNWRDYGEPVMSGSVNLCYLDLPAMRKLSEYDAEWGPIAEVSVRTLAGGQTAGGLFYESYDYGSGTYAGERGNMIHQALAAGHLAAERPDNRRFIDFIRHAMESGGIVYAEYDVNRREPTAFFESTSVYGICARLAFRQGDRELAGRLLDRMRRFQVLDPGSELFGAFCDDEVYSFDNLQALRALREYQETRQDGG